jgi:acyl carrier protein
MQNPIIPERWLLVAVVIIGMMVVAWFRARTKQNKRVRQIEQCFAGRAKLSPAEFYAEYFVRTNTSFEIVSGVLGVLGDSLLLDTARLQPRDDFTGNLRFLWDAADEWADVEIVEALEKKFGIKISDSEAATCRTVSDIISLVSSKLAA